MRSFRVHTVHQTITETQEYMMVGHLTHVRDQTFIQNVGQDM